MQEQHRPPPSPQPANSTGNAVVPAQTSPSLPATTPVDDDAMDAVRQQVTSQLNDLDSLEDQTAPSNAHQAQNNQPQQQPQPSRDQTAAPSATNTPTHQSELDDEDDVEEEVEDGEEDTSSSELELTIRSSQVAPAPAAAAAATPAPGSSSGGSSTGSGIGSFDWRPNQQSNRDLRSWHVFRTPSRGQDGRAAALRIRRRHRRNSAGWGGAVPGSNSNTHLLRYRKPAAFSQVSERNSVCLGTGLRDLAVLQLRQMHEQQLLPPANFVRLAKAQFDQLLRMECQLPVIVGGAKSSSAKPSPQLQVPSARRRAASWAAMSKENYRL